MKKDSLCIKGKKCKGTCINNNLSCAVSVGVDRSRDLDALVSLINSGGSDFDDNFYIEEGKRLANGELKANLEEKFNRNDRYAQLWYSYDKKDDYSPYVDILKKLSSNVGKISTGKQLWNDKDEDAYIYAAKVASKLLRVKELDLEAYYDRSLNDPVEIATHVYDSMARDSKKPRLEGFSYFCSPVKMSELYGKDPELFYLTVGALSL